MNNTLAVVEIVLVMSWCVAVLHLISITAFNKIKAKVSCLPADI